MGRGLAAQLCWLPALARHSPLAPTPSVWAGLRRHKAPSGTHGRPPTVALLVVQRSFWGSHVGLMAGRSLLSRAALARGPRPEGMSWPGASVLRGVVAQAPGWPKRLLRRPLGVPGKQCGEGLLLSPRGVFVPPGRSALGLPALVPGGFGSPNTLKSHRAALASISNA